MQKIIHSNNNKLFPALAEDVPAHRGVGLEDLQRSFLTQSIL